MVRRSGQGEYSQRAKSGCGTHVRCVLFSRRCVSHSFNTMTHSVNPAAQPYYTVSATHLGSNRLCLLKLTYSRGCASSE
jgi:hypothetical protein